MTISDLFALADLLDKYIVTLDVLSAEYERAIMVNSEVAFLLSEQVKGYVQDV